MKKISLFMMVFISLFVFVGVASASVSPGDNFYVGGGSGFFESYRVAGSFDLSGSSSVENYKFHDVENPTVVQDNYYGEDVRDFVIDNEGYVYYAGMDNLVKMTTDGDVQWINSNFSRFFSVMLLDGYLYAGNDSSVIKFDKGTGSSLWTYSNPNITVDSLSTDGENIFCGAEDMHKITPSGNNVWTFGDSYTGRLTSVTCGENYVYAGCSYEYDRFYQVYLENGQQKDMEYVSEPFFGSGNDLKFINGYLYYGPKDTLKKFNVRTWSVEDTTGVIDDSVVCVSEGTDGYIYVSDYQQSNFYKLEASDLSEVFSINTPGDYSVRKMVYREGFVHFLTDSTGGSYFGKVSEGDLESFGFSNGGNIFYGFSSGEDIAYSWDLSTAFDLTGAENSKTSTVPGDLDGDVYVRDDGLRLYSCSGNGGVDEYSMGSSYDFSTLSFVANYEVSYGGDNDVRGFEFYENGNFMLCGVDNRILSYSLSTPFDLSTRNLLDSTPSETGENVSSIVSLENGSRFWTSENSIYQYSLEDPYDLSTVSYESNLTEEHESISWVEEEATYSDDEYIPDFDIDTPTVETERAGWMSYILPVIMVFAPALIVYLYAGQSQVGFIAGATIGIVVSAGAGLLPFWVIPLAVVGMGVLWFSIIRGGEGA